MKRILLPTDFSDNAWKAMCYAAQLYAETPVKYILINNFSAPYDMTEGGITGAFEPLQHESTTGLRDLMKQFKDLDHHPATEFETLSSYGPVHGTIEELENEPESHVVVMGTRGASGFAEMFLGTTTVGVIKNVQSPVIAVPYKAQLEIPSEILLAIDTQGVDNLNEIRPMLDLAKAHNSKLSVVNVHAPEKELVLEKDAPEQFVLDHYLEGIEHSYYSIDDEYTEDTILRFAHGMNIDLITLIHRDRGFWKNLFHSSLTSRLAYHSDVPLLIVKDN